MTAHSCSRIFYRVEMSGRQPCTAGTSLKPQWRREEVSEVRTVDTMVAIVTKPKTRPKPHRTSFTDTQWEKLILKKKKKKAKYDHKTEGRETAS